MFARTAPLLAVLAAAAMTTAAPSVASPSPKAAYVFAVKQAVMERCSGDVDIIYGLVNSTTEETGALGRRDVHRIVNACSLRHRVARRAGLAFVAMEALESEECLQDDCREEASEPLATATYALSATYTADYADLLYKNLKDACSKTHDLDCVDEAIALSAETAKSMQLSWLEVDAEGRLKGLGEVETARYGTIPELPEDESETDVIVEQVAGMDSEIADILKIRDIAKTQFEGDLPAGDLHEQTSDALASAGFETNQDGIKISENMKPISISGVNGLLRISVPADRDACVGLLSGEDALGATEIAVGKKLWVEGSDPEAVCPHVQTNLRIVYQ